MLSENILKKIYKLYEIAVQIKKYWVHIESFISEEYKMMNLRIKVYAFSKGKEEPQYFMEKEIDLNTENAEKELDSAIEELKQYV